MVKKKRQQVQKPILSRPSYDAEEDNAEKYLVYRNLKKKQINCIIKEKTIEAKRNFWWVMFVTGFQ